MLLEALLIGAVGSLAYSTDKSIKLDEKALKQYSKAFEKDAEARELIKQKEEYTDKRLQNVARKKRAIIDKTIPQFVSVYEQIQKVNLENHSNTQLTIAEISNEKIGILRELSISRKKEFTDQELICCWLFKGLGKCMVKDSEMYLSAANMQLSIANTTYEQARSICTVYDGIIARADRIAKILAGFNALFVKIIASTNEVIQKNGLDVKKYSRADKETLMTCVNVALATIEMLNVPVLTSEGTIPEESLKAIVDGESYLDSMQKLLNKRS